MTIQQCKYVLAIAKTGSFSQAANQLFVAQSSLSVSIKTLEQELNIRIFERSGNGVYLTDDGAEFVSYAAQIVENNEFIVQRYRNPRARQKLHIATQHYDFIADIFGQFVKNNKDASYQFSIKEIETYNVIREVELAYSDIGIIALKDSDSEVLKRYLHKKNISFVPLLNAAPHVFLHAGHPLAGREKLRLSDLKDFPYVSYEQGEHSSSFFTEEIVAASGISRHIEISDRATLMNLLMITDAYTVGTGLMPSALNRGDIVSIPLESAEYYIIGYLLNENRKISGVAKDFIALMEQTVKNY